MQRILAECKDSNDRKHALQELARLRIQGYRPDRFTYSKVITLLAGSAEAGSEQVKALRELL